MDHGLCNFVRRSSSPLLGEHVRGGPHEDCLSYEGDEARRLRASSPIAARGRSQPPTPPTLRSWRSSAAPGKRRTRSTRGSRAGESSSPKRSTLPPQYRACPNTAHLQVQFYLHFCSPRTTFCLSCTLVPMRSHLFARSIFWISNL